jgi:hypothetical protein
MNFNVTKEDSAKIAEIVGHVASVVPDTDRLGLTMDLTAAHARNPLDLDAMLGAVGTYDFHHDITGIVRHLNRRTGKLEGFFSPRFTKRGE